MNQPVGGEGSSFLIRPPFLMDAFDFQKTPFKLNMSIKTELLWI
jgi:hypothetical protein